MNILCLSAYEAKSHEMWRHGLQRTLTDHQFTHLILPPRHFRWRRRSNPLTWFFEARDTLSRSYDVVIATNSVDSATLRGLVPNLANTRWITYFHENQFAYPTRSGGEQLDANLGIQDLYSALCANLVVFNSDYNRDSFIDGVERFRRAMPDHFPKQASGALLEKSDVIPVGVDEVWFEPFDRPKNDRPRIVWNHRWEWDKAPDRFVAAIEALATADFELVIAGQQFREQPAELVRLKELSQVVQFGRIESREAYIEAVRYCDIVVSTALHEFQGLAVLEAMAAGCRAIVPDRLAYREYVPDGSRFESFIDDAARDIESFTSALSRAIESPTAQNVDLSRYHWRSVGLEWERVLNELYVD